MEEIIKYIEEKRELLLQRLAAATAASTAIAAANAETAASNAATAAATAATMAATVVSGDMAWSSAVACSVTTTIGNDKCI